MSADTQEQKMLRQAGGDWFKRSLSSLIYTAQSLDVLPPKDVANGLLDALTVFATVHHLPFRHADKPYHEVIDTRYQKITRKEVQS